MKIKLIVLRTADPKRLADFFELLGCTLDYHKHGNSPYHYSTEIGETVLEIYPLAKNQADPDRNLRLGFEIGNFENTILALREKEIVFSSQPGPTDFGYIATVVDPDGRKIDLYKAAE